MIVIGVHVHKQSLTAVAIDEAGRMLDERTVASANDGLVAWASSVSYERLWAPEDCRQLTRALERELLAAGEELVRVPPKLMAHRASTARRETLSRGLETVSPRGFAGLRAGVHPASTARSSASASRSDGVLVAVDCEVAVMEVDHRDARAHEP